MRTVETIALLGFFHATHSERAGRGLAIQKSGLLDSSLHEQLFIRQLDRIKIPLGPLKNSKHHT